MNARRHARPGGRALRLCALLLPALLAGCAATPSGTSATAVCRDASLGWAVGQPATEDTMRRLLRESGAGLINPIGPATSVRGDSRADRLRVFIDGANTITAVRCE